MITVFPADTAQGFPLGPVIAPGSVLPSPPPAPAVPVRILGPAAGRRRDALPVRHGLLAAAALAALAIVACCWSVAALSGAWSRAVPVVAPATSRPTATDQLVPPPPNATHPDPIAAGSAESSSAQPSAAQPSAAQPSAAESSAAESSAAESSAAESDPRGLAPPGIPVQRPGDNPLFTLGLTLSVSRCALPPYSAAGALHFATAAVDCLDRVWAPVLVAAGSMATPVRLLPMPVAGQDSPCGVVPAVQVARYCDGTIYLTPGSYPRRAPGTGTGGYLEALAHEYGHHLQRLSGVTAASSRLRETVGDTSAGGLVIARRQELQASCLAGMAIAGLLADGSLPASVRDQVSVAAAARGDSPRHGSEPRRLGSPLSNKHWFTIGFRSARPGSCNTWAASPAEVN
jgi:hypothetical protein